MTDIDSRRGTAARAIVEAFEAARDPAAAEPMAHYMRDQFKFLGISSPARRALQRAALAGTKPGRDDLLASADALWRRPEREYQYAACDLLIAHVKQLTSADLETIGSLIVTKSWWDTVDALAINVVGPIVLAGRAAGDRTIDRWIESDNLWMARTAILHQNKWKAKTDQARLFAFCEQRAGDTDFFMRKAIGWALREYSRTAPDAVRAFVATHQRELSGLSQREALKRLGR